MKNKTNNSTKSIKKNALRRQARKYGKTIAKLEDEKKFLKKNSLKTSTPARSKKRLVVSQEIWGTLSPHAKKKSKQVLRDSDHSGFKRLFQEEVGINLSNPLSFSDKNTAIQKAVWNFMTRDDVSHVSPSVKTLQLDGDQAVPVR